MVWKCPNCPQKFSSYKAAQKHYFAKHYKSKAKKVPNKGRDKKVYKFKPHVGKR